MPGVGIDDRRWGPEAKWDYRGVVKDAFVASAYKPPVLELRDKVYVHAEMEINKSGNHELKRVGRSGGRTAGYDLQHRRCAARTRK